MVNELLAILLPTAGAHRDSADAPVPSAIPGYARPVISFSWDGSGTTTVFLVPTSGVSAVAVFQPTITVQPSLTAPVGSGASYTWLSSGATAISPPTTFSIFPTSGLGSSIWVSTPSVLGAGL